LLRKKIQLREEGTRVRETKGIHSKISEGEMKHIAFPVPRERSGNGEDREDGTRERLSGLPSS